MYAKTCCIIQIIVSDLRVLDMQRILFPDTLRSTIMYRCNQKIEMVCFKVDNISHNILLKLGVGNVTNVVIERVIIAVCIMYGCLRIT